MDPWLLDLLFVVTTWGDVLMVLLNLKCQILLNSIELLHHGNPKKKPEGTVGEFTTWQSCWCWCRPKLAFAFTWPWPWSRGLRILDLNICKLDFKFTKRWPICLVHPSSSWAWWTSHLYEDLSRPALLFKVGVPRLRWRTITIYIVFYFIFQFMFMFKKIIGDFEWLIIVWELLFVLAIELGTTLQLFPYPFPISFWLTLRLILNF